MRGCFSGRLKTPKSIMSRENVPNHKQLAQLSKNVRTRHTPIKLKEQNAEEQQRARLSFAPCRCCERIYYTRVAQLDSILAYKFD